MNHAISKIRLLASAAALGLLGAAAVCGAVTLPASIAMPVRFTHTIDARKSKPGDVVLAKTTQVVILPNGRLLPKGSTIAGHVVEARSFAFDPAASGPQTPSVLAIHFDRVVAGDTALPVNLSLRALANASASYEATVPVGIDESDHTGTLVLIGGDAFSPLGKEVIDSQGEVVGYHRRQGVFARLLPSTYRAVNSEIQCGGTEKEQSVGIFSPNACGLYGFGSLYLQADDSAPRGTFELNSRNHTVKLYAQSEALLETF
jgi:hypothetical protein